MVFVCQTSWSDGEDESVSTPAAGDVAGHAAQWRPRSNRATGTVWAPHDSLSLYQGCYNAARHATKLPQPPSLLCHPAGSAQPGQPGAWAHPSHLSLTCTREQPAMLCARYPLYVFVFLFSKEARFHNWIKNKKAIIIKTYFPSQFWVYI